jgi:two-component system chemotaxis sensor kinase CheA
VIPYLPFRLYYSCVDDLTQREFLADLEELIEQLFTATEDLRHPETSSLSRRELVAKSFRCLHSIKGLAASAGFSEVVELAHQTETTLDAAHNGRIEISTAFIDALEDVASTISESLSRVTSKSPGLSSGLLVQLGALAAGAVNASTRVPLFDLPTEIANSLDERERQLVLGSLRPDARLCLISAEFEVTVFDTAFQRLRETLARYGEVVCTQPSAKGAAPNHVGFRLFFTSAFTATQVQDRLSSIPEAIVTSIPLSPVDLNADEAAARSVARPRRGPALRSGSIRIELDELNRLRFSAHEVFEQIVAALDLVSASLTGEARTELSNLDAQVRQSLTALEETIVELRTTSVDRVCKRAIIAGRMAARSAGREVEFSICGSDLRIDKVHCDTIAIPLLHLVRNAVDHGIETVAERELWRARNQLALSGSRPASPAARFGSWSLMMVAVSIRKSFPWQPQIEG